MIDKRVRGEKYGVMLLFVLCTMTGAAGYGLFFTVSQPDQQPVILALSVAWLIHAFVSAFTGKAVVRLDTRRFRFARWEHEGRFYEWLGVRPFRWALFHTGWALLLNRHLRLKSGRSDLERLSMYLNFAEVTHAMSAVVTIVAAAAYVFAGHLNTGIWLWGVNIPLNIYPVILQRWNRGRVLQVQRRLATRAEKGSGAALT
ncbi:MAG: hypothetical protein ABIK28_21715 [Planctomycetota bacterium]